MISPKAPDNNDSLSNDLDLHHIVPDKIRTRIHIKFTPPISTSYYCCTITNPRFHHDHGTTQNSIYYFRLSKDAFLSQASLILNGERYTLKRKIHTRNFYTLSASIINAIQASITVLPNDHYALSISANSPINIIKIRLKFYSGLFHNSQRFTYLLPFEISGSAITNSNLPVPQQNIFIDHSILVTVSSLQNGRDLKTNYNLVNQCGKYQTIQGTVLEPLMLSAMFNQSLLPHRVGNFYIQAGASKKNQSCKTMPLYIMVDTTPSVLQQIAPFLIEYNDSEHRNNDTHQCQFQYRQLLSPDGPGTSAAINRRLIKSWCVTQLDNYKQNTNLINHLDLMLTRVSQLNKPYKVIVITDNKDPVPPNYWDNITPSLVHSRSSLLCISSGLPNCSPWQEHPIQERLLLQNLGKSNASASDALLNILKQLTTSQLNNEYSFDAKTQTLENTTGYSVVEYLPVATHNVPKRTHHMAIYRKDKLINHDIANHANTEINTMLAGSFTAVYKVSTLGISDHGHYTTHLNKMNEDNMNYQKAFLNQQNIKNYLEILKATRSIEQPCALEQQIHNMENQRRQVNLIIIHLFKLSTMIDPVELTCLSNLQERHTAGMSCYLAKWFIIICQLSNLPLSQELMNTLNTLTQQLPESAERDLNNEFGIS